MTTPSFKFGGTGTQTTRGTDTTGEAANEFIHPLIPASLTPASGYLLVLNGWNLNRSMPDTVGHDGTAATALRMLQMRAPRQEIMPLLSWLGTGRVFRPGAKWRYRWYDSRTGEHSGLSPVPSNALNVGAETPPNSQTYLGQTAYFYLPTASAPSNADTIQLFANTTNQDDTWYLTDESEIAGASYVTLTGNKIDDELFTALAVVTGTPSAIPAGPTWNEGIMWPCVKAWNHPTGRTFYFGVRRYGRIADFALKLTVNEGSDLCTITSSVAGPRLVEPGRTGQRVRFYRDSDNEPIDDPTVYRLVKVEGADSFRVTPEVQISTDLAAGGTDTWHYAIEDDRDARWTWMSEPNKPWLIDPLKVLAAGDDYDDGAMHWFSLSNGSIFMQTRRRIYEVEGGKSEDPSRASLFVPRADEGTTGFESGCETPFGWVYFHEDRGVRLFDGVNVRPLTAEGDPFGDFSPSTQFDRVEPASVSELICAYDAENRVVLVSYVPTGQGTRKEVMVFDTSTRRWRGPYRDRVSAVGTMRSTTTSDKFVTGDDFGNLLTREEQSLDVVPSATGFVGFGTGTSWTGSRFLTDTGNSFDGDSDSRLRGSPIWFTRSDGELFMARIADVLSDTQIELDGVAVSDDGTYEQVPSSGYTYEVGSLRWSLTTAYIEPPGNLAQPVQFYKLNTRFKRGVSADSFEVGASEDANGTFAGVRVSATSEAAPTRTVTGEVHGEMRLMRHGALTQLRLRGLARSGEPEIVGAVLEAEAREGALPT